MIMLGIPTPNPTAIATLSLLLNPLSAFAASGLVLGGAGLGGACPGGIVVEGLDGGDDDEGDEIGGSELVVVGTGVDTPGCMVREVKNRS